MIYRGFIITVRPSPMGFWADFDRPNEEYNTRIPRPNRFEAIRDAQREIDKILLGEKELVEHLVEEEQTADYPRPWEKTE